MAYDRSLHASLREEVQALRKKVVALETAEADNEKLRKELAKLRVSALEQKSQLEMEFMNQLTGVARENALRLEELEGRLAESANVNRILSEKLCSSPTPESVAKQMEDLEAQHRKDLACSIDANKAEIERTRKQLVTLMESRDQLVEEFDEVKEILAKKEKEIETLKAREAANDSSIHELEEIRHQLAELQISRDHIAKALDETTQELAAKNSEISTLQLQIKTNEEIHNAKMEETLKELTNIKVSQKQLEEELRETKDLLKGKGAEVDAYKSAQTAILDANQTEVTQILEKVSSLESSRHELLLQLEEAKSSLRLQQEELDLVKSSKSVQEKAMLERLTESEAEAAQLRSTIKTLQAEAGTASSTSENVTQILKDQLRTLEEELDSKSNIISQLQASVSELTSKADLGSESAKSLDLEKSKLKETVRKLEMEKVEQGIMTSRFEREKTDLTKRFETESRILKQHLSARDEELTSQKSEIRRLESQVGELTIQLENAVQRLMSLETDNSKLKVTIAQLETENDQQKVSMTKLEASNFELTRQLEHQASSTSQNRKTENDALPQTNVQEKKTTQIIRRLEQNLKKECQTKQAMVANLKNKAAQDNEEQQVVTMKEELVSLRKKLESERDQTITLRREVSELRAKEASSKRQSFLQTPNQTTTLRVQSKNPYEKVSDDSLPRTPVRGLVQTFEMKKSHKHNRWPNDESSSCGASTIEELKEALHFEKQQVLELEDELTRQCEINCSLLKEIATLTQNTESSRSRNSSAFHGGNLFDKKKIENLSAEISKLKDALETAQKENARLSSKLESLSESSNKDRESILMELELVKGKLAKAEGRSSSMARFEDASATDRKEMDRLKKQIRQLEDQLSESQLKVDQLHRDKTTSTLDVEKLQKKIAALEDERQSKRRQAEEQEIRISQLELEVERLQGEGSRALELENELGKLELIKLDYAARGDEIAGLKSLVEGLEASLAGIHETDSALQNEKETSRQLESSVKQLKQELETAEEKIATLAADVLNTKQSEQEKIERLTAELESLTFQLSTVSKQKDDQEKNCRLHHEEIIERLTSQAESLANQLQAVAEERDEIQEENRAHLAKFDSLRSEIDQKVEEFEKIHNSDKVEIDRLQDHALSLEKELQDRLLTIDDLKKSLKEREQVEETVENLQRENQQSFDSQISRLQKELVAMRLTEAESKRKVLSLEHNIAAMQQESKKVLVAKDTIIEDMRKSIADKEQSIDRLAKEKEQLVLSMKDMTDSRRDEIDELQKELMEMSTRAANQAREIQTLKVQLEESGYRKEEMERLRTKVRELSQQLAGKAPAMSGSDKTSELQIENSELRQRLRDANLAIKAAEGKMRELAAEKGSSKSMQVLRDRNASLKFEVEKLTRKLQKLAERKHMPDSQRPTSTTMQPERSSGKDRYAYGSEERDSKEATRFMI